MDGLTAALRVTEDPAVAGLDLSVLDANDLGNIVLQRSEVISDQPRPNRVIRAWRQGEDGPIAEVVDRLGTGIARRAAALIWLEYQALRPILADIQPRTLADIGCGYGIFDLFAQRDFGCRLTLIDTETNNHRRFHFSDDPAAYTSLDRARALLVKNGCPPDRIVTANPMRFPLAALRPVDLAVSFIACGFHFPWETYGEFFDRGVTPDGSVIFDLRRKQARGAYADLRQIGQVRTLGSVADGKGRRLHLRKQPPGRIARAA